MLCLRFRECCGVRRCSVCGLRSEVDGFFRREKGGLWNLNQTVCEGCEPYRATQAERRRTWVLPFSLLTIFALAWLGMDHGGNGEWLLFGFLAGWTFGSPLATAIHEGGHALTARVLGHAVVRIVIGYGPAAVRLKLGRTPLLINRHVIWGGGRMFHIPPDGMPASRLSRALVTLAKAAVANIGAAGVAITLCAGLAGNDDVASSLAGGALVGLAAGNALMAVMALWPHRLRDETLVSDGLSVWRILRGTPAAETLAEWRVAWLRHFGRYDEAAAAAFAVTDGMSEHRARFLLLALSAVEAGHGPRAALDCCFERTALVDAILNSGAPVDEAYRPVVQANIAWFALQAGDQPTEMIEHYSAAAMTTKAPPFPDVEGVRGAWLAASARDAASGLDMLVWAIRRSASPEMRADFCAYAARACRGLGDAARARGFEQLQARLLATA